MDPHSLAFIDNNGSFSIMVDIKDGDIKEWHSLAEHITKRVRLVAGHKAEIQAYNKTYTPDDDDYWYKYGDFPAVLIVRHDNGMFVYDDTTWNEEDSYYWDQAQIETFFLGKYDGAEWSLGESEIPLLIRQSGQDQCSSDSHV